MQKNSRISRLRMPFILMFIFWTIAVVFWLSLGKVFYLLNFGYIGTALGVGIAVYNELPRKEKLWGRCLAQILIGGYMLVFLGFIQFENMQIEGFFFYLLAGFFAGSVIHYLVAKLFGPLIFNRGWCGWACWTAMVLDLLPYRRNRDGRLKGHWEYLRYIHFFISLGLVLSLWWFFHIHPDSQGLTELYWLLGGNLLYYAVGISLALALKDNRAFCKYVCPIPTLQKITSRFSLLKVGGKAENCTNCGACNKMCPMDIRISDYIQQKKRVLSTECILCLECIHVCPKEALDVTCQLDAGWQELLRRR